MENLPANKHYFVQTDPTFRIMLDWIRTESQAGRLHYTGYREVQLHQIYSQNQDDNQMWSRVFDFGRTSSSTLRLIMLRVTGLDQYFDPEGPGHPARNLIDADLAEDGQMPLPPQQYTTLLNNGNHLAGNAFEARWVAAHFDMLFPHFRIESRIDGMQDNQVRSLNDQMVVVDLHHRIAWNFVVTLKVTRLNAPTGKMRFLAIPFIAVHRLELNPPQLNPPQQQLTNYPFPPPLGSDQDENIEDIQTRMREMRV